MFKNFKNINGYTIRYPPPTLEPQSLRLFPQEVNSLPPTTFLLGVLLATDNA